MEQNPVHSSLDLFPFKTPANNIFLDDDMG